MTTLQSCQNWLTFRAITPLKKGLRPDAMRRNLLSSSVEFTCRYWQHPGIVEDYRIGEAIRNAQAIAAGVAQ